MTPIEALHGAYAMLPDRMNDPRATLILMAIQLQENPKRLNKQVGGPAVGDYQFEKSGGIRGVLRHPSSRNWAMNVCAEYGVHPDEESVYGAILSGDDPGLDAAFARLLLWTDPEPLPPIGDVAGAWNLYLRTWRPGAAKRDYDNLRRKWSVNYAKAMEIVR